MRAIAGRAMRLAVLVSCSVAALLQPRPAVAHVAIDEQIDDLTSRLAGDPGNASLYLRRGELHRIHGDWRPARADYRRARSLDPELEVVDLCLGRLWLEAGRPRRAKAALDRFLARRPDDVDGLVVRARALARLGRTLAAAADLTRAIERARPPRLAEPEEYLDRARLLADAGGERVREALRGLDEGVRALGPIVTLELAAIDLEIRLGRYDAALERLDLLAARAERREVWLVRRATLLDRAGRHEEARRAYGQALEAIAALPPERRASEAVRRLEEDARAALDRPGAGSSGGTAGARGPSDPPPRAPR